MTVPVLTFGIRNGRPTYASTGQIKLSSISSRLDKFLISRLTSDS
jgi:hypothetical protein